MSTTTPTSLAAGFGPLRIVFGVICLVLGLIALFWPGATLLVLAVVFGVELIVAGGVRLATAATTPATPGASKGTRILGIVLAVLTIIAGVICLFSPGTTLLVLIVFIAVGWLMDGASEVISGLGKNRTGGERITLIVFGVFSVIGALLLLIFPGQSLVLFARIGGVFLILFAVITLVSALQARRRPTQDAAASTV